MHFPTAIFFSRTRASKNAQTPILQSSDALETWQYWHDYRQQSKQKKGQGNVCWFQKLHLIRSVCLQTRYLTRLTPPNMSYFPDTVWNVIDNKSWKTKAIWCVEAVKLHYIYRRVSNFTLHCTRRKSWVSYLNRFWNLFACLNETGRSY